MDWSNSLHEFLITYPNMVQWYQRRPFRPAMPPPDHKCFVKFFAFTITYQAIRSSVCDRMWARFETLMQDLGHHDTWPPEIVASLTDEQLLGVVKLSKRKASAVRDVALIATSIDWSLPSEALVLSISSSVKGVGRFTVEHILWSMGREDVFCAGDIFVRRGMCRIMGVERLTETQARKIAKRWDVGLHSIATTICRMNNT